MPFRRLFLPVFAVTGLVAAENDQLFDAALLRSHTIPSVTVPWGANKLGLIVTEALHLKKGDVTLDVPVNAIYWADVNGDTLTLKDTTFSPPANTPSGDLTAYMGTDLTISMQGWLKERLEMSPALDVAEIMEKVRIRWIRPIHKAEYLVSLIIVDPIKDKDGKEIIPQNTIFSGKADLSAEDKEVETTSLTALRSNQKYKGLLQKANITEGANKNAGDAKLKKVFKILYKEGEVVIPKGLLDLKVKEFFGSLRRIDSAYLPEEVRVPIKAERFYSDDDALIYQFNRKQTDAGELQRLTQEHNRKQEIVADTEMIPELREDNSRTPTNYALTVNLNTGYAFSNLYRQPSDEAEGHYFGEKGMFKLETSQYFISSNNFFFIPPVKLIYYRLDLGFTLTPKAYVNVQGTNDVISTMRQAGGFSFDAGLLHGMLISENTSLEVHVRTSTSNQRIFTPENPNSFHDQLSTQTLYGFGLQQHDPQWRGSFVEISWAHDPKFPGAERRIYSNLRVAFRPSSWEATSFFIEAISNRAIHPSALPDEGSVYFGFAIDPKLFFRL